jgi:hypothetical protein
MPRRIDKLRLLNTIGRQLQSEMTYEEIKSYMRDFGVNVDRPTSGVNSKWRFVKDLLADETLDRILDIAEDLEIPHGHVRGSRLDVADTRFWLSGYFRLFLSHVSNFKEKTAQLQSALKLFGISAFVAHEDIEPTKEWQDEIERALFSMHALAAVLTPGFHESRWTDQEVGVALGRNLLVISVRRGLDPYGLIGKSQGLQAGGKTVGQVAEALFLVLAANVQTNGSMAGAIVSLMLFAQDFVQAGHWLSLLTRFERIPLTALHRLREGALQSSAVATSDALLREVNSLLKKYDLDLLVLPQKVASLSDDDIPF